MKIVRLLLDKDVKVDMSVDDGFTLLHFAAKAGHAELLKILLKNRADINRKVSMLSFFVCVLPHHR